MNRGLVSGRKQKAIEFIGDKLKIDLAVPMRVSRADIRSMLQLERIAEALEAGEYERDTEPVIIEKPIDIDAIMKLIYGVEGVGPSTGKRIRAKLEEVKYGS